VTAGAASADSERRSGLAMSIPISETSLASAMLARALQDVRAKLGAIGWRFEGCKYQAGRKRLHQGPTRK